MINLMLGDCLNEMKKLDDNSVDSIVTDPPYGLSFMGKAWDKSVPSKEVWQEALRVLKPGGHLLAFAGTRTQHRMAVNIEDAGFEIRDMIAWVYGSGFPKSLNVSKAIDKAAGAEREVLSEIKTNSGGMAHISKTNAEHGFRPNAYTGNSDDKTAQNVIQVTAPATDEAKQWEGWGTALKPALEPITVARKPLEEKTVAANVLKYGTGGINIDASRVPLNGDYKSKSNGRPSQTGLDDNYDSEAANQPDTMGRFPANFIHDGSDEVTSLFPHSKSGKMKPTMTTSLGYHGNGSGHVAQQEASEGSAARFFYCAKVSRSERDQGLENMPDIIHNAEGGGNLISMRTNSIHSLTGKPRTVNPAKNNHPTVKPQELMKYLIRLVTPEGGTVLDPFMGSGSTGMAAKDLGLGFIGIDLDPDYIDIAKKRIEAINPLQEFFEQ
jgi:DNA modification methylase